MSNWIAALPMYDWPERHAEVDVEWANIRDALTKEGIDAPECLTRDHGDLLDFWRSPNLLLAQTCWGPLEQGLEADVQIIGQPSYDGIEGGDGEYYSSALVMRSDLVESFLNPALASLEGTIPPLAQLRGARFAYNVPDSMSGIIAFGRDLEALSESLDIFSERIETGGHRASIRAVAEGRADLAAIDCKSWALAQTYEPAAAGLRVVGWTGKRLGLPFITAKSTPSAIVGLLRQILKE